jgi:hypothetical protein
MSLKSPIPIPLPYRGLLSAQERENFPPDAASESENWIHRDDKFQVRPGLTSLGDQTSQRATGMVGYELADGTRRIVMGTTVSWWAYNEATNTWTDLANGALTASAIDQQVFRPFELSGTTLLIGTNGADAVKKWNGSNLANNFADLGGSPPKARCMMVLADRLLLGNLKSGGTVSPLAVDVSARLNIESGWQSFVSLLADTAGPIIVMSEWGNFVGMVYKTDAIYRAIATSGANPFRYELMTKFNESEGVAATNALVKIGDGSDVYLSRGAEIKRYTGQSSVQPFGSRDLSKFVQDTANVGQLQRAWGTYDSDNEEILFVYAEKGSTEPSLGVLIKERSGAFWPIRWTGRNMTAAAYVVISRGLRIADLKASIGAIKQTIGELGTAGTIRRVIMSDLQAGGQVYESVGDDDAGAAIPFFSETGLFDLGSPLRNKTVRKIFHRFSTQASQQEITIKIGTSKYGEPRVLSDGDVIDIGQDGPYKTHHRITSKFLSVRLEGLATRPVVWHGSFADAAERGFWR